MKDETLREIFRDAHAVAVSMNDTFYYACADAACIDVGELEDLEPVIEKCGFYAFVAYEAFRRGHDPQVARHAQNPKFIEAKKLIQEMMDKADPYGELFELRSALRDLKAKPVEQRKRVSKFKSRLKDWFGFFLER